MLIRWMAAQGYRSFADLDRDGCDRFMAAMAQRPGSKPGKAVMTVTLQHYANLLTCLYLQGAKFLEVANDEKRVNFAGLLAASVSGATMPDESTLRRHA
ncbi:hypothetical protein [Mesorhizobium sp. L48C026A00]|uniref:hypothetical protein n=1 Tax=Mesorhizobium sp. L48C026A00 TaxID=1287182 RepID=UPI0003D027DC|nr:hypothetical protein [Mesorhizobium sp. L48C026A00]ESZ01127.1 hypothetical protein X737_39020 [Mesorhizobium sp. L48C026A00]